MNNEIKYVSPFKKFCITVGNLPTAYLESMSYYEGLTYLVNYLSNNVIPALNHNGEVVEELQSQFTILKNYVDNYFENLDVQEEINNKLDEMADSGQLTDIIAQYLGLAGIVAFDTISDLIAAENVVDGSKCKTYGYHSVNDGGGALYYITDTVPLNEFYEILDSGKYAVLCENNELNVKQFGAYGDGTHDDSLAFQTAIDNIRQHILNKNNTYELDTLTIPGGTYRIENTIELSPLVKIKTSGTVIIDSYIDGSCFHLLPKATDNAEWYHYNGKYITSSDGIMIINKLPAKGTTIGLEISTSSSVGSFKGFMHGIIEDITFKGFKTGLLIHACNVYCVNFNGLKFLDTTNNVQWGDNAINLYNAGERITFRNCQFGSSGTEIMVLIYATAADMNFIDCSFDYGNCVLYDMGNKGYSNFNFTQCHFEGISYNMSDSDILSDPYGIVYGDFIYSNINFSQCNIGIAHRRKMFHYINNTNLFIKFRLNIIDCEIGTPDITYDYSKIFWIDEHVNAYIRNTNNHLMYTIFPNIKNNIIENPYFDLATLGEVTVKNNSIVGGIKISYNPGFNDTGEIITNAVTGKNCLKLKAKINNPSIQVISEKFDVLPGDKLNVAAMTKNFYTYTVYIKYYDSDDNEISETTKTPHIPTHPGKTVDSINAYTVQDYAPYRARKATVRIMCSNTGQTDTVLVDDYCYIDGIFCYKN